MKRKEITKFALVLSVVLIIVCLFLGTASTIAWFADDDVIVNTFQFGNLDVELYRKVGDDYVPVSEGTKIFKDEALYEPGYTQVVYLKVRNAGDVPFDCKLSVLPDNIKIGTNVFGQPIVLTEFLRFGIVVGETEEEVLAATRTREDARSYANTKLNHYDEKKSDLEEGAEQYIALIVCMPEEIGNEANSRGNEASVDLAIRVKATQIEARGKTSE